MSHPQGRDRQRAARGPSGKAPGEIERALAGGQALPRDSLQYLQLGLVVRRPDVLHARPPAPEEYTTCTIVAPDAVSTVRAYGTRPLTARISAQIRSQAKNPQVRGMRRPKVHDREPSQVAATSSGSPTARRR